MDGDDLLPKRSVDPLSQVASTDLDVLSVDELLARIASLESEILRVQQKIETVTRQRASADALFRK